MKPRVETPQMRAKRLAREGRWEEYKSRLGARIEELRGQNFAPKRAEMQAESELIPQYRPLSVIPVGSRAGEGEPATTGLTPAGIVFQDKELSQSQEADWVAEAMGLVEAGEILIECPNYRCWSLLKWAERDMAKFYAYRDRLKQREKGQVEDSVKVSEYAGAHADRLAKLFERARNAALSART